MEPDEQWAITMGSSNDLKLRVLFDMVDGATKPLRNILNGNKSLAKSLKASRDELGKLQEEQGRGRVPRAAPGPRRHRARAGRGATSRRHTGPHDRRDRLADEGNDCRLREGEAHRVAARGNPRAAVRQGRRAASACGAGVQAAILLPAHGRELRADIASTTGAMGGQMTKLDQLAEREKRNQHRCGQK